MPHPMPVPILTNRKSSTERAIPACFSPSAMMLTSLSTSTGQPSSEANASRTGKWFQPGMIGGETGVPSAKLTRPGTPAPAPARPPAGAAARSLPAISRARPRTTSPARPRNARPGPGQPARGVSGPQLADHLQRAADHHLRALPYVHRLCLVREHPQLAVGDGDVDRGGPDVDAEEAGVAGDADDRGAA